MNDNTQQNLKLLQSQPEIQQRFEQIYQRPVLLKVEGLHKYFQTAKGSLLALKNINLKIHRRELICVIGASGCGKSTLSRIIAGLEPFDSGSLQLDGQPITDVGADRGMVFQGYTLFPWRTVKQNVMFGPQMRGQGKLAAEQAALQWLDLIGLSGFADHYPHQLSGGMKQRVAIARALVNEPRVLLMDEPFGALDPHTRQKMQQHLLEIWKNIDITIVFVTHDMDEAILLADRIVVLKPHPGELQEIIEVPLTRPRHPKMMDEPAFRATREYLDDLIHGHDTTTDTVDPALDLIPQIPRMTRVDDNAE
ncbi:MAG: ABC transporter ATP-binding protein [Pseudomonadota bacterium]|nr:ABC transporter ATP-binding protein [Pseudomonadota bacterium]